MQLIYVNMQSNNALIYVNTQHDYVNMQNNSQTCMLNNYVAIHMIVNIIMLHVDIIYLSCRGQNYTPYELYPLKF